MVHMRMLNELVADVKERDPETALTKNAIRQLGLSGKVPTLMVGKRRLYNEDAFFQFLDSPPQQEKSEENGGIRPVPEKLKWT